MSSLVARRVHTYICLGSTRNMVQRRWIWQLARHVSIQAQRITQFKDVRFGNMSNTFSIRLGIMSNPRAMGLVTCQAHVRLILTYSRVQERWVQQQAKLIPNWAWQAVKPKVDVGQSLRVLRLIVTPKGDGVRSKLNPYHLGLVFYLIQKCLVWVRVFSICK